MINVWGDAVGAGIIEKLSKESLDKAEAKNEKAPITNGNTNLAYNSGSMDSRL